VVFILRVHLEPNRLCLADYRLYETFQCETCQAGFLCVRAGVSLIPPPPAGDLVWGGGYRMLDLGDFVDVFQRDLSDGLLAGVAGAL
jgi:hypothetical protein